MKSKPTVEARLTWPQVHAFRLRRHHLDGRARKSDLAKVVGEIGGAQAQLMSAAEMQIAVRVDCGVDDIRNALWTDRALVKTWLMRGTLHLARADDLPIYTGAMSRRWIKVSNSWLKFWQITEAELWSLTDDIGVALDGKPLTREELIAAVARGKPPRIREALSSGWGGMLKPAARNGRLCFGPSRGQNVTFVSPRRWLHTWRDVDPDTAMVEAARRYLRVYGPATKQDFARWWGNWAGVANAAWSGLKDELAQVEVGGARYDALASDVDGMRKAKPFKSVRLLPLFDPYLMGYATRDHLFDRVHAPRVSRTAGWISAVVLVDGTVAGTWSHTVTKGNLRIGVAPFQSMTSSAMAEVRKRAIELAKAIDARKAEVEFG